MAVRVLRNQLRIAALLASSAIVAACASEPWSEPQARLRTAELREELLGLDAAVDGAEAERLSQAAIEESAALARQYRAMRPAWFQNFLVNGGLRERGLCYQWTNDLFARLQPLGLRSLELHLAVARMDTPREHNCIVVTARNRPFEEGVALDAWRDSGRLWFGSAKQDKYPWGPLPEDRVAHELRGLLKR